MSLLNWFSRKPAAPAVVTSEHQTDPGVGAAVTPLHPLKTSDQAAASRKIERSAHREFLYDVVRNTMIRVGVLAASYKFKVLSLDARGLQYLIMMDVDKQAMDAIVSLNEIEAMMTQAAKARHDLQVTAVYWRGIDHMAAGLLTGTTESEPPPKGHMETSLDAEVAAFKRRDAGVFPAKPPASSHAATLGRRQPEPAEDFQDTQIVPTDEHGSPLGTTQYGHLK